MVLGQREPAVDIDLEPGARCGEQRAQRDGRAVHAGEQHADEDADLRQAAADPSDQFATEIEQPLGDAARQRPCAWRTHR